MVLLTPGPCMTSPTARAAAATEDMNHREPEFEELVADTKRRLLSVYAGLAEGWSPYLVGGSGTAAVEALVVSCVREGPVLVIENGTYSGRIADILDVHRIPHERYRLGWTESWTEMAIDGLRDRLRERRFEAVVATHNETTLGRLNPVGLFADLCRESGTRLFVDAMSSFGADPLGLEGVDAVVSSANKCLHGLPGVSFVLLRHELAEATRRHPRRSFYLHLPMYEGDNPPLTPPVPMLRALHQALAENPSGQRAREAVYREKIGAIRRGLGSLGFAFAVPDEESSCTLAAPNLPAGWSWDSWFLANHRRGFALYGCKGDLRERYFLVSAMGEVTVAQIESWLGVVRELLA